MRRRDLIALRGAAAVFHPALMGQKENTIFRQRLRSYGPADDQWSVPPPPVIGPCYCLFFRAGIEDFQRLDPDLFLSRAPAREGGGLAPDEVIE